MVEFSSTDGPPVYLVEEFRPLWSVRIMVTILGVWNALASIAVCLSIDPLVIGLTWVGFNQFGILLLTIIRQRRFVLHRVADWPDN